MTEQRKYESALHKELGMTDAEIRAELVAEGLDPDEEARALRTMIQRLVAKHATQSLTELSLAEAVRRRFTVFDESVSAGPPTPAGGQEAARLNIWQLMRVVPTDSMVWARVSGWSMRDASIRDGDLVLVDRSREPRDGDIVLAHLDGEGQAIKRLRLGANGSATLESANPDFAPIAINDSSSLAIHGVVVGRAGRL